MTKNDRLILSKPVAFYLFIIALSYGLRLIHLMPVLALALILSSAAPVIVLLWEAQLISKKKGKTGEYSTFMLYAMPGVLFGFHMLGDTIRSMYGYMPNDLVFRFIIFSLLSGLIFGFAGRFLQNWLAKNKTLFKNLLIGTLLGAVFGALLFYGAMSFLYSNIGLGQSWLTEVLFYTILAPVYIGGLLCNLLDNHTFGCMAVNFWVFPFVYAVLFLAGCLMYVQLKGTCQRNNR